jgi:hypothetical protein
MKKFIKTLTLVIFLLCFPLFASAYTVTDQYWGGAVANATSTAYGDVIGNPYFNVDNMNVTHSGSIWTVAISGQYFTSNQNPSIDNGYPSMLGPGDLYINSNGWIANIGTGHYETDTFSAPEGWNYIVTNVNGVWGLYTLDYRKITYTNVAPYSSTGNSWIYRQNQAWRDGAGTKVGDATYSLVGNTLTFTFDAANVNFGNEAGFHWTMECGNDVIEGKVPVPEPSILLLFGMGLFGLGIVSRKLKK